MELLLRAVPPSLYLALAMTEPEEKAERYQLMQQHGISELDAAFKVAEKIDRAHVINTLQDDKKRTDKADQRGTRACADQAPPLAGHLAPSDSGLTQSTHAATSLVGFATKEKGQSCIQKKLGDKTNIHWILDIGYGVQ